MICANEIWRETASEERKKPHRPLQLFEDFTIDLWSWTEAEDGALLYPVALSCLGITRMDIGLRCSCSEPLVGGTIAFYADDGERFCVLTDSVERPDGMTMVEAVRILNGIFEDSGRGGAVDEDWVWRPVQLEMFLRSIFYTPRDRELAALVRRWVRDFNLRTKFLPKDF